MGGGQDGLGRAGFGVAEAGSVDFGYWAWDFAVESGHEEGFDGVGGEGGDSGYEKCGGAVQFVGDGERVAAGCCSVCAYWMEGGCLREAFLIFFGRMFSYDEALGKSLLAWLGVLESSTDGRMYIYVALDGIEIPIEGSVQQEKLPIQHLHVEAND
jgi:hypothetical protein